jgi:hypothetical protein
VLYAGAARRVINPPLGTRQAGFRLFGNPVQAVESDLTSTALVLDDGSVQVVLIAIDLPIVGLDIALHAQRPGQEMRERVGEALGIPPSHVLLNTSHTHAGVALPGYATDTPEQILLKGLYKESMIPKLAEAAVEAQSQLQPARVAVGWGESLVGVYRRETVDGHTVLGEVPDHPIDASVGVIRIDDLDGAPIAILFRYSCHPVTMGPLSAVVSSDFPGPARDVVERALGGLAFFLLGAGGNINPRSGIGLEVDCRDTKTRVGLELGAEVLKIAATLRTNTRRGERRQLGNIPNILFAPWEAVRGERDLSIRVAEATIPLDFVELPSLVEAQAILEERRRKTRELSATLAPDWEIRVAEKFEEWAELLVEAVDHRSPTAELFIQVFGIGDELVLAGMNAEPFFESGLEIRARSPFTHTFVLGLTNGTIGYIPRAVDYPPGGWDINASYATPDMICQFHPHPAVLRPDSEERAVRGTLELVQEVASRRAG